MKNRDIITNINNISRFDKTLKLPVKVAFAISKNYKNLLKAYEPYEDTLRQIREQSKDNQDELNSRIEELLDTESEVDVVMISMDMFPDDTELSFDELLTLNFMICD